MTTGELFAGMSLLGGAGTWVFLQARAYFDERAKKIDAVVESVNDIRRALLGDGYGHAGLVAEFAAMKRRIDEIEHRLEVMENRK